MQIFAVISLVSNPALGARIEQSYPDNNFALSDAAWLVAGSGTSQEVSSRLGLVAGEFNNAVVIGMDTYHGRAPVRIWDWMKAKLEAPVNG